MKNDDRDRCCSRSETKISLRFLKLFFPSPLAAWCSSMLQDIANCVLGTLVQKEVLNLLYTYVAVLTLATYNPCNGRYLLHVPLCLSIAWATPLKLGIQNPHNKGTFCIYHLVCWTSSLFLTSLNFFDFCDWFQKKWALFNIQKGKSLASKSLGRFPVEFCSRHIQWGFQNHNRQLVKHERDYQWIQQNGTNRVVLVTLLSTWKKIHLFTILRLDKWIRDER